MNGLVYVLPVHNEEKVLAANVERVTSYLGRFPGSEVYLVENGSSDASWALCEELAARSGAIPVRAFRESNAGIGYAYHRGLEEAVKAFGADSPRWAVLTAADLPFGFSDLEAALSLLDLPEHRILMGSKAHASSQTPTGLKRQVMSAGYRIARRAVLGMRVGDSQGSVFLRLSFAAELLPRIVSRNFFYSTELCHFAERAGARIIELPVILEESQRTSTVKPLQDSVKMAKQLWELRQRG